MARGKRGKGAAANDDTDFDQGGPDGPARLARESANGADTAADDDGDGPGRGHNRVYDGEYVRGALEQIMAEKASIKAAMDAARIKTQPQRKKIAATKKGLQESGIGAKELTALLKKLKLEKDLQEVDAELDDGQKHEFERILAAMGDFADSPLGAAALAAAEADTRPSAAEPVH